MLKYHKNNPVFFKKMYCKQRQKYLNSQSSFYSCNISFKNSIFSFLLFHINIYVKIEKVFTQQMHFQMSSKCKFHISNTKHHNEPQHLLKKKKKKKKKKKVTFQIKPNFLTGRGMQQDQQMTSPCHLGDFIFRWFLQPLNLYSLYFY